ncbi:hypothetical protein N431DRAFT_479739 [Stipitochalara longipes BDJ]|nr:hypothetical protein N431DRAFT_479739 [Stipitochalara longipes BDJ]
MLCYNVALLYFFVFFRAATAVQITNTNYGGIQTGSPFNVTWTDAAGPVTILLRMGNTTDPSRADAKAIWVDLLGTSFQWYPGSNLGTGLYRFQLDDAAVQPVYSPLFELTYIPGVYTTSTTTTSATPTATSQGSVSTSQSSDSTPTSSSAPSTTASSTSTVSSAQTNTPAKVRPKTAVKVGVIIALLFFIALTTYFVISLIRSRAARKKRASEVSAAPTGNGDGTIPKDTDLEHGHGRGAEMSGALDSAVSISNGVSSPTISSSRRPSTRPTTGSDLGMEEVMEEPEVEMEPVEIGSSEQGPVEIGSSGYGKEMSAQEKGKAVEMEANQRIRFEERKRRRRGVRLLVGRRKVLF